MIYDGPPQFMRFSILVCILSLKLLSFIIYYNVPDILNIIFFFIKYDLNFDVDRTGMRMT